MADWFDGIEIFDEIAFDDGPLETPTTWYDISDSVLSFRSFVGKTSLDTEFAPGYASLRLDNSEGHFTPQNTLGDYYPNVKPMRRFRRRVMVDATEYVVFTGYVLSWDQDWRARTSYVDVPLVDGSRLVENTPLQSKQLSTSVLGDSPLYYFPCQEITPGVGLVDDVGDVVADWYEDAASYPTQPTLQGGGFPLGVSNMVTPVASTTSATLLEVIPTSEVGSTPPNSVEAWVLVGDGTGSVGATYAPAFLSNISLEVDASVITVRFSRSSDIKSHPNTVEIPHGASAGQVIHVAAAASSSTFYVYVNGVARRSTPLNAATLASGNPRLFFFADNGNGTSPWGISHVAFYSDELTAAEVAEHHTIGRYAFGPPAYAEFGGARIGRALDDAGFPAGLRDLDDGQTIHGPYLPAGAGLLDYLRQIERAEQGLLYFGGDGSVTFRDRATLSGGAGTVIFSDDIDDIEAGAVEYTSGNPRGNPIDWIRNIVTASYAQTGGITRRDTTSITDYGEARQVLDTPTLPDGRAASNLTAYVLRERKDPKSLFPALTVEMRPNTIDKMHELFGLAIGSVVTVRRTPFDLPYEVEETGILLGMEHENPGDSGQWYMTLYLAPAPTQYNDADTPLLRVGSGDDTNLIGAAAGNIIIA